MRLHPDRKLRYSPVLWTLVLGFSAALAWSIFFDIDQTIRSAGTLITRSRVQVIQAVDGGVLESLKVTEGDRVERDQILAVFNQTRCTASVKELDARLAALFTREARLRAEVVGAGSPDFPGSTLCYPDLIRVEKALFRQRRQGFTEDIKNLTTAVDLAVEEKRLVNDLAGNGDASRSEVIKAEQRLNEARGRLIKRKNTYYQEVQLALTQVEDEIGQNQQIRNQRVRQLENSVVTAPVAGIVKNVRITTLGGVLGPGEELMQILPVNDTLLVEARVRPADIAAVTPGLTASLRFDAFDYTIFGAVEGRVSYVSADTLREKTAYGEQAYYRVHLRLAGNPVTTRTGRSIRLVPGMTAQVDIRIGKRSLIAYLLKPLKKTMAESLGEK